MFMGLVLEVASCTSVYKQAPEQIYLTVVQLFMFMGFVLKVASCTSVYKQAPEQVYLTVIKLFMFTGLVLEVASCTSVYKQAPEQTCLTVFQCFYVYELGAFSRILYFRVHTGTKTNLFNGYLVVYVYGLGAFNRILYFSVQTGTKPYLFNRGFSCLCLRGWCFQPHLVLLGTNRHQNKPILQGLSCLWGSLVVYVYGVGLLDASCTSVYHKTAKKIPTILQTPDYGDISVHFCSNRLVASMEFRHLDLINKQYDQIFRISVSTFVIC